MKKADFIVFISLYVVLSLFSPHLIEATTYVDNTLCMNCHSHDDFLSYHFSYDCSVCHNISGTSVATATCNECHPINDTDGSGLIGYHANLDADCLSCHIVSAGKHNSHMNTCLECHNSDDLHAIVGHEGCEQCHFALGGKNVTPGKCVICHPLDEPGTCNLADDHGSTCFECHTECAEGETTTTTTSPSEGHIDMCIECHVVDELHAIGSHNTCTLCHSSDEVGVGACAVCHPADGPGFCNLVDDHGSACFECHTECTGGETTTTTPSPSEGHIDMCIKCHVVDDLHAIGSHNTCTQCHSGDKVGVGACAVCHPTDGPGKCRLVSGHGSSCFTCHNECVGTPTTTTTSPFEDHISMCLDCHIPDDLHAIGSHNTCARCHEGRVVRVGTCAVCHPTDGPGTCNLAAKHGSSCLTCHSDCTENTTTTTAVVTSTTTTIDGFPPVVDMDITTHPKGAFRSHFIPLPLIMFIEGTGSNFNQTTRVSFDGDALLPPISIVLSPKSIFIFSILRPIGFKSISNKEVIVSVSSTVDSSELGMYEEIGSCSFFFVPLPF